MANFDVTLRAENIYLLLVFVLLLIIEVFLWLKKQPSLCLPEI